MGPFSPGRLQEMRDRGQFRAFHEVSEDRASWRPASSLSGFFAPELAAAPAAVAPAPRPVPPPAQEENWFFVDASNKEVGPVTRAHLDGLFRDGAIRANSQVW